jgi:outer membrane protein TolC
MYMAPTTLMPDHAYGLTASMSLPWLWGAASHKAAGEEKLLLAASLDTTDAQYRIGVDVATAFGSVKASEARLLVLAGRALPAAKQALDVALASYRSGQGDVLSLLRAERAVVDAEVQIIMMRVALEHALVDLDWAVGARVARSPIPGGTP